MHPFPWHLQEGRVFPSFTPALVGVETCRTISGILSMVGRFLQTPAHPRELCARDAQDDKHYLATSSGTAHTPYPVVLCLSTDGPENVII